MYALQKAVTNIPMHSMMYSVHYSFMWYTKIKKNFILNIYPKISFHSIL